LSATATPLATKVSSATSAKQRITVEFVMRLLRVQNREVVVALPFPCWHAVLKYRTILQIAFYQFARDIKLLRDGRFTQPESARSHKTLEQLWRVFSTFWLHGFSAGGVRSYQFDSREQLPGVKLHLGHHPTRRIPARGLVEKALLPDHRFVTRSPHRGASTIPRCPAEAVVRRQPDRILQSRE
jgi:hypothetical protein